MSLTTVRRASLTCIAILVALLASPNTSATGAPDRVVAVHACPATSMRASLTAITINSTGEGGQSDAGMALAVTNVSPHRCILESPLTLQFANADHDVGALVTTPGFLGKNILRPTYQGLLRARTVERPGCSLTTASSLRVTAGPASSVDRLPRPVSICRGGAARWTYVSAVTFPRPSPCAPRYVRTRVGRGGAAAGTAYLRIAVSNVGPVACTVHGVPDVQPATRGGTAIGPDATKETIATPARGETMVITKDGVTAYAPFGVETAANFYPPARCAAVQAQTIRVALPGYQPTPVRVSITVCTKLRSTEVWGIAPPWDEL